MSVSQSFKPARPSLATLALLAVELSFVRCVAQECCPRNWGPQCNLPACPSGMVCSFVGEEIGPPKCVRTPAPTPAPVFTVATVAAALASPSVGFKVGAPLEDPYGCSPTPCGDLSRLGPLTRLPSPVEGSNGSIVQRFEFANFTDLAVVGKSFPDGREWERLEISLQWKVESALGLRSGSTSVGTGKMTPDQGVCLTVEVSAAGSEAKRELSDAQ